MPVLNPKSLLHQVTPRDIHTRDNEICAFLVVRNELLRLPWNLQYHRRLGVNRFFVVDNDSDDGTLEFLRQQPDVCLFHTAESFSANNFGMNWVNELLDTFGLNHWCLIIDADEMFIYPNCEWLSIRNLCGFLEQSGASAMFTPVIDMYGPNAIRTTRYRSGEPFLETCPYFDPSNYEIKIRDDLMVPIKIVGGARKRLFWDPKRDDIPYRLSLWLMRRLSKMPLLKRLPWKSRFKFPSSSLLSRTPLVKWQKGYHYVTNHALAGRAALAVEWGALLHFKLFSDFFDNVAREVKRKEHYLGTNAYEFYWSALKKNPNLSALCEGSKLYRNSAQLADLGLLRSSEMLQHYCDELSRTSARDGP